MEFESIKVSEYLRLINDSLESHQECVIEGEVSEFRVSQGKWVSFNLKDETEKAVLPCFMTAFQLKIPIEDGMKVLVQGQPRIYAPFGKFSLNVRQIQAVGEGSLKRAFELNKQKLAQEGLFAPERKRPLPKFPERIGLVTSTEAAAYTDFLKIIDARFPGLEIFVMPVHVQGKPSVPEICHAFSYFNKHHVEMGIEAIVLTRGGGSLEDLQAFNDEAVARAIFGSRVPVVCGVGHERDESLADYVADVRASTPSNAAELLVRQQSDVLHDIATCEQTMGHYFARELDRQGRIIERFVSASTALPQLIEQHASEVASHQRFLTSLDPAHILKRGYSIARTRDGALVRSTTQAVSGTEIDLTVSDGTIKTIAQIGRAHDNSSA